MINKTFELERLRSSLLSRGIEESMVNKIIQKADQDIEVAMAAKMDEAMAQGIELGVEKDSAEFINELRPAPGAYALETESGNMDFSDPPFPMLPHLLQNAKPLKDGSGVYKVIPVGKPGNKPSMVTNIFDAQKAIQAERVESSKRQYNKVVPQGSAMYRTATSKQNQATQWVKPATEKDFSEDVRQINNTLEQELNDIVLNTIRDYEDGF